MDALHTLGTYFAMGGYAVYVWPAYGVAVTVLSGLALYCWRRYRQSMRTLEDLQRQSEPRR